jgi:hypothetical protein
MVAATEIRKIGIVSVTTVLLIVALAGIEGRAQSSSAPADTQVSKLRILYAGHPGSDREKDFVRFLGQHFETVKTVDLGAFAKTGFKDKDAEGFDVTIFDYDGDGFKAPQPPVLPRFLDEAAKDSPSMVGLRFTRPLITVGVAGGLMCSRWSLKTGYL